MFSSSKSKWTNEMIWGKGTKDCSWFGYKEMKPEILERECGEGKYQSFGRALVIPLEGKVRRFL